MSTFPCYRIQTQRAVENFTISGCQANSRLILANGMIKAGAAADFEMKLMRTKSAGGFLSAAEEVIEGMWDEEFVVDVYRAGAGALTHTKANAVIAELAATVEFQGIDADTATSMAA